MAGAASNGKSALAPDALSERDKAICDGFLSGQSRQQLANLHKLTVRRIGQILHLPAAIRYLAQQAGNTKTLVFAKAGGEILARFDWGGIKMTDLIAVWKAAMPQEIAITLTDHRKEAEAIAAEIGKADDPAVVAQIEQDLLLSQVPSR